MSSISSPSRAGLVVRRFQVARKQLDQLGSDPAASTTYAKLCSNSDEVFYKFPISANRIETICHGNEALQRQVEQHARATRPIIHGRMVSLIEGFLQYKVSYGSEIEQELYKSMSLPQFVDRLIKKRPLVFMMSSDLYLLRTLEYGGDGTKSFDNIGTTQEVFPFLLADYMSYEEMEISAMLTVSTPTFFINPGDRGNRGVPNSNCQASGVYVALVGSRFERPGRMEYKHMVISQKQNTRENGYGKDNPLGAKFSHWCKFYNVPYFPSFEEVKADDSYFDENDLLKVGSEYFNVGIFKRRCEITAEIFFAEANDRARASQKKAHCVVVGLGLGVWLFLSSQRQAYVDAFVNVLATVHFPYIASVDFSWFRTDQYDEVALANGPNNIEITFTKSNPADKLEDPNKILVCSYAWDGNSYPGNEYWLGNLSASGDPAAACCSTIQQLQNPDINSQVCGENTHVVVAPGDSRNGCSSSGGRSTFEG